MHTKKDDLTRYYGTGSGYKDSLTLFCGFLSICIHTNIFTFKAVFNVADELLKTANQNPRLALHKAKAGWILLGALMTLGK